MKHYLNRSGNVLTNAEMEKIICADVDANVANDISHCQENTIQLPSNKRRQLMKSSDGTAPIWKIESFELDPHRSLGVVVHKGNLRHHSMHLVEILWVKPSGQGALVGLRRGDLIYEIGERRMRRSDDIYAVLAEQVEQACLSNRSLRLVILRHLG